MSLQPPRSALQQPQPQQPLPPRQQQAQPSGEHLHRRRSSSGAASPPTGRGARGAAAAAAAAAATPRLPVLSPLLLERGYHTASLSHDKLSKQQQEYICNMGAALRALQQDLPAVLERQPDLAVYADNVVFEDRLSPRLGLPAASCQGREAYARLLWSLRFHGALFFCKTRLDLLRVWEKEPGLVCVRWCARASPRLLDGLVTTDSAAVALDGVSEFGFNEQGFICRHTVDCLAHSGPRVRVPLLARYVRPQMVPGLAGGSLDEY